MVKEIKKKEIKTNWEIPFDLKKEFKLFCARNDLSMKEGAAIAIETFMKEYEGDDK
jgi:hypothetical protein